METKRPQLSFEELRQLKWFLGGALALLSVWTVAYLDIDAWVFVGIATAGITAGLVWPSLPGRVPALVHRLAFPVIVAVFLADLWITGAMMPAIVRLDLFLLLYRGVTYRQRRDDLQVLVLGLFLIVVAGVISVSLVFAAQLLVFTAAALVFLLAVTIVDVTDVRVMPEPPGQVPGWAAHVSWPRLARRLRRVIDWRVATLGALLFAGVVAVSAVLFTAIPRFQIGDSLFLDRLVAKRARTGFNDTIHFGDISQISEDNAVAMNVDVSDPAKAPAVPYWRMLVLDDYRDGTFRVSPAARLSQFGRVQGESYLLGTERSLDGPSFTVYLEPGVSRFLPLLGPFSSLRFREQQYFQHSSHLGVVALRDEPATMTAYKVDGMLSSDSFADPHFFARQKGRGQVSESGLYLALHLSAADRSALEAVDREVSRGADGTAESYGKTLNRWLAAHHGYSLSPDIPSGSGDPLVRWVTSSREGHCELFAGAFVILARAHGLPARVVTGFKGGTWNGYSSNYTVRNSDAHAWAELWDASRGLWLREDPLQPAAAGAQAQDQGAASLGHVDRSWSARLDSLRVFWYRRIVNFDQQTHVEAAKAVRSAAETSTRALREWLSDALQQVKGWFSRPWDLARFGRAATGLCAAGLVLWVVRLLFQSARRWGNSTAGLDPQRAEAGRLLRRLGACDDPVVASLRRIRFGRRETWPQTQAVFREARRVARQRPASSR